MYHSLYIHTYVPLVIHTYIPLAVHTYVPLAICTYVPSLQALQEFALQCDREPTESVLSVLHVWTLMYNKLSMVRWCHVHVHARMSLCVYACTCTYGYVLCVYAIAHIIRKSHAHLGFLQYGDGRKVPSLLP